MVLTDCILPIVQPLLMACDARHSTQQVSVFESTCILLLESACTSPLYLTDNIVLGTTFPLSDDILLTFLLYQLELYKPSWS